MTSRIATVAPKPPGESWPLAVTRAARVSKDRRRSKRIVATRSGVTTKPTGVVAGYPTSSLMVAGRLMNSASPSDDSRDDDSISRRSAITGTRTFSQPWRRPISSGVGAQTSTQSTSGGIAAASGATGMAPVVP